MVKNTLGVLNGFSAFTDQIFGSESRSLGPFWAQFDQGLFGEELKSAFGAYRSELELFLSSKIWTKGPEMVHSDL